MFVAATGATETSPRRKVRHLQTTLLPRFFLSSLRKGSVTGFMNLARLALQTRWKSGPSVSQHFLRAIASESGSWQFLEARSLQKSVAHLEVAGSSQIRIFAPELSLFQSPYTGLRSSTVSMKDTFYSLRNVV